MELIFRYLMNDYYSRGAADEVRYYTKDWYWSVSNEGLSVGFQPVPDQDEYTAEDIERIHRDIVQQTYEEELLDLVNFTMPG